MVDDNKNENVSPASTSKVLEELLGEGARKMLQEVIVREVAEYRAWENRFSHITERWRQNNLLKK